MHDHTGEQLIAWLVIAGVIALCWRRSWRGSGTSHGTARWASDEELRRLGFFQWRGLVLGRTRSRRLVRLPRYSHVLLIGGTGSGKGVSVIIPQLLTYTRGSCIVFDTKGDLFSITSARRRHMGQRIIDLAPFANGQDTLNVLDVIQPGPMLVDHARAMAEALVVRQGTEPDPHWNESAVMVICGILVFVLVQLDGPERSLNGVREISSDPVLLQAAAEKLVEMGGITARLGHHILGLQDKERSGVLSTVGRHLAFLDSEPVARVVAVSSFDPKQLCRPGTTLYIRIPPDQLEAQRGLLRCLISILIRVIGTTGNEQDSEVLALLDEASALGSLPALEEALVRGRSTGIRLLLAYQSDSQVRAAFEKKPTLIYDNTDVQLYVGGASGYETAERISKMLGDATITVESAGSNGSTTWQTGGTGDSRNQSQSWSRNWSEHGRPLLRPEEVLTLSSNYLIAFVCAMSLLLLYRIKYYADPAFGTASRKPPAWWWVLLVACLGVMGWAALHARP